MQIWLFFSGKRIKIKL